MVREGHGKLVQPNINFPGTAVITKFFHENSMSHRWASEPRSKAGHYAGAAVQDARGAKGRTYPEFLQTRRCKLSVLAIDIGGRWSQETTTFLRLFAQAKARTIPTRLKASFTNVLLHQWSAQITHAAMTRPPSWNLTASQAPSQTATNLSPLKCWPRPPSHQPQAPSQPPL